MAKLSLTCLEVGRSRGNNKWLCFTFNVLGDERVKMWVASCVRKLDILSKQKGMKMLANSCVGKFGSVSKAAG